MKAATLATIQTIAAKKIRFVWTIVNGRGYTYEVQDAYIVGDVITLNHEGGALCFKADAVTRFERCVNNAVNICIEGHREEYTLFY